MDSIGDAVEEGQNQRENMERAALQQIVHSLMVDHGIFVVASKYNLHHLYIQSKKYNNTKAGPSDPSNTIRLAVSNLHTSAQLEHAVQCLLAVSEKVCRDLYDAQAVDVATNESSSSKTSKKKKSSRSKSTGRKR